MGQFAALGSKAFPGTKSPLCLLPLSHKTPFAGPDPCSARYYFSPHKVHCTSRYQESLLLPWGQPEWAQWDTEHRCVTPHHQGGLRVAVQSPAAFGGGSPTNDCSHGPSLDQNRSQGGSGWQLCQTPAYWGTENTEASQEALAVTLLPSRLYSWKQARCLQHPGKSWCWGGACPHSRTAAALHRAGSAAGCPLSAPNHRGLGWVSALLAPSVLSWGTGMLLSGKRSYLVGPVCAYTPN